MSNRPDEVEKWGSYLDRLRAQGKVGTNEWVGVQSRFEAALTAWVAEAPPPPLSDLAIKQLRNAASPPPSRPKLTLKKFLVLRKAAPLKRLYSAEKLKRGQAKEPWYIASKDWDEMKAKLSQADEVRALAGQNIDWFPIDRYDPSPRGRFSSGGWGDREGDRYCGRCKERFRRDIGDPDRCARCFAPRIPADEVSEYLTVMEA